ncbi:MAG: zinc metalloprotease HtpX [Microcystaceae cyanobacterium]
MSFKEGLRAFKEQRFEEAIDYLTQYCEEATNKDSFEYCQAQMALAKAYHQTDQIEEAIAICATLKNNIDSQTSLWAVEYEKRLKNALAVQESPDEATPLEKAGRAAQTGVKLAMKGIAGSLAFASTVTISLLFGMVLTLFISLIFIMESENPTQGLGIALVLTVIFSGVSFFLSPIIMDITQSWLYGTNWISLDTLRQYSPESAEVIERVCREKRLAPPRLGIIEDENPTAFTYGSLPDTARLVVSRGLFTYLDDDEAATVYAHELGHIVHWDFAVMTLAATLVQVTYLLYTFLRRMSQQTTKKVRGALIQLAITAYLFYLVGTYLILYLSRTREYYADHFAAETTGNPNGLSRALVKIAYGIVEERDKSEEPSKLVQGTRALGIYDPQGAASTGTAYRMASDTYQIGKVFLWDMFNPWGGWMELHSTHPLTGKRIRALTTYAEQMGLKCEFDMARVIKDGKYLNKKRLYGTFFVDLIVMNSQWIGGFLGLIIGGIFGYIFKYPHLILSFALWGFALATILKLLVMYPDYHHAPATDILTLMGDPYASPLRGKPVRLKGELIGRGDAGYQFGSDLKLQDPTGMIFARYASRFGAIGNFLFGAAQVKGLLGAEVKVVGWFRRGIMPWLDLVHIKSDRGNVESYHRFSMMVLVAVTVVGGLLILR